MAKIIKFALELKNGESARTIEDLRKHFDLEKIVAYFMNGRLLTWLKHRHLDDEAAALEKLSAEDAEFAKKLCDILEVSYDEHQKKADTIDANTLMADHERLNRLRQVTTDPEILAKIDRVAFDGKDLRRLAFDNETDIYLCSGRFVIPLNVQNKHYIGLGKVEAVIVSDEWVDFDEKGIQFTNVTFDDEYQRKVEALETPEKWAERGWKAYCEGNYAEAMKWNRKAAEAGNSEAMNRVGDMYYSGDGVSQ
ncbi:MAG: sel1 repeat family protein, partial [Schwartzia sp.]|nr:sel1 repeat family protein [Schwartzia sp. (in: firmicutes)]